MIQFIIGSIIGTIIGAFIVCCIVINRNGNDKWKK